MQIGREAREQKEFIVMNIASSVFGDSRTHLGLRHALIAPDGQVPSSLPGIEKATAVVLIAAARPVTAKGKIKDMSNAQIKCMGDGIATSG